MEEVKVENINIPKRISKCDKFRKKWYSDTQMKRYAEGKKT